MKGFQLGCSSAEDFFFFTPIPFFPSARNYCINCSFSVLCFKYLWLPLMWLERATSFPTCIWQSSYLIISVFYATATSVTQILSSVVQKIQKALFFALLELAVSNQGSVCFQSFALTIQLFFGTLRTPLPWPSYLFTNKICLAKCNNCFSFSCR